MNSSQARRTIAAGMIGNVLEWYDFAIYGYFASEIGKQFFRQEDPVSQLLSAFGVFASSFTVNVKLCAEPAAQSPSATGVPAVMPPKVPL